MVQIIKKIELNQNGRNITITMLSGDKLENVDIACLSIFDPDELEEWNLKTAIVNKKSYLPLTYKNYFESDNYDEKSKLTLLMPIKNLVIADRSLLNAVCSGHYIELSQQYFYFLSGWPVKSKREVTEINDEY